MLDMAWLKEAGFISSYEDFINLPAGVLQDAFMVRRIQQQAAQQKKGRGRAG